MNNTQKTKSLYKQHKQNDKYVGAHSKDVMTHTRVSKADHNGHDGE